MSDTTLATLAQLKTYLGVSGADDDALLQALLNRVAPAAERACGRTFAQETVTEYHDGKDDSVLVLVKRPVESVASVHDDLDRAYTDDALVSADDYVLYPDEGLIELDAGEFRDGLRNVKVVYTAGYAAIPADVTHACVVWAAAVYNRAKEGGDGLSAERLPDLAQEFLNHAMPPEARQILDRYQEVFA